MIPFMLDRADEWLTPAARTENNLQPSVAETFRRNFWITTSACSPPPSSCSCTNSSDPTDCCSQSTTPSAPTPKDAPSSTRSRSTRPTNRNSATAMPNAYYASHRSRPHHHDPDPTTRDRAPKAPPGREVGSAEPDHSYGHGKPSIGSARMAVRATAASSSALAPSRALADMPVITVQT